MQLHETPIAEVKRFSLNVLHDSRGFFTERFRLDVWRAAGLPELVQMNHSRSAPGVLRGLHLQHSPAQGKLVGVTRGKIFDVAVDVRPHSPSYLQHVAITLNETEMLWIPEGFLHGFCVLGEEAPDVVYYTSATYHAAGEAGVRYDDPSLAINWPLRAPILSERDTQLPYLVDAKNLYKA
jgi:dTDP-4-dehydrorhamnose 3,5-epimerase